MENNRYQSPEAERILFESPVLLASSWDAAEISDDFTQLYDL